MFTAIEQWSILSLYILLLKYKNEIRNNLLETLSNLKAAHSNEMYGILAFVKHIRLA